MVGFSFECAEHSSGFYVLTQACCGLLLFLETFCDWAQIHHVSVSFMFVLKLCKMPRPPGPPGSVKVDIYKVGGGGCDSRLVLCSYSMLPTAAVSKKI